MGTRGLTCVVIDNEYKIAQYGQWDHYPEGQGLTILDFLRSLDTPAALELFITKVRALNWLTPEQIKKVNATENWPDKYPYLSRDMGGGILGYITFNEVLGLVNETEFAKDSLFCEWAYVVDIDKMTLEVYRGFNKQPVDSSERFYFNGYVGEDEHDERDDNFKPTGKKYRYHPIVLLKSYDLTMLPDNDSFVKELNELAEARG